MKNSPRKKETEGNRKCTTVVVVEIQLWGAVFCDGILDSTLSSTWVHASITVRLNFPFAWRIP